MADPRAQQAAFRQRRRDAGYRKLSIYLEPDEAALVEQLKAAHGLTDKALVKAALVRLAAG